MSEVHEPVIDRLDLFNARDMSAKQVVDKFVQPHAYDQLRTASNTLVMGPRGSGKTTLLKMLTPEAIERVGVTGFARPAFEGLYIPIDVQLSDRLESMYASNMPPEFVQSAAKTLYALHVFRSVARSFAWHCSSSRLHSDRDLLTVSEEARLVTSLAGLWRVEPDVPVIGALQDQTRLKQARLLESWSRQLLRYQSRTEIDPDSIDVVDLDIGLKGATELLSETANWPSGDRWAVLFDEVEVAPTPIQEHLISYLRHSDGQTLFKVAISPYMQAYRGIPDRSRGSALNDYTVIDLQDSSEDEIHNFSTAFFEAAALRQSREAIRLTDALGPSVLTGGGSRDASQSYGPRSHLARTYASLANKDGTFADYLHRHGVDSTDLISGIASDQRAPIRKVRQVAMVREAYIREALGSRRIKSQNSAARLYSGADSVIRMCEGNPRRLAFITPMLLAGMDVRTGHVPTGAQVEAVARTEAAFRSFVRGLPVSESLGTRMPRGVLSFIDRIGQRFHLELVSKQFQEDPVSSFIVDSSADDEIEQLIALGVNSGALVQLSDSDSRGPRRSSGVFDPIVTSRGKRFRLSYLLSPHYGLTLRIGRAASLNRILSAPSRESFSELSDQPELPSGE